MTNTQLKCLNHASDLLKSIESYRTYATIGELMKKENVHPDIINKVQDCFSNSIGKEMETVRAANDWVDAVIKDAKTKITTPIAI